MIHIPMVEATKELIKHHRDNYLLIKHHRDNYLKYKRLFKLLKDGSMIATLEHWYDDGVEGLYSPYDEEIDDYTGIPKWAKPYIYNTRQYKDYCLITIDVYYKLQKWQRAHPEPLINQVNSKETLRQWLSHDPTYGRSTEAKISYLIDEAYGNYHGDREYMEGVVLEEIKKLLSDTFTLKCLVNNNLYDLLGSMGIGKKFLGYNWKIIWEYFNLKENGK